MAEPAAAARRSRSASFREWWTGVRQEVQLQLGRQLGVYAAVDAVLVGLGLLSALTALDDTSAGVYVQVVLMPLVLLAIPALADTVALERRAGCLELALAAPSGERYFLRRALLVGAAFALQGVLVMLVAWLLADPRFPLLTVEVQVLAVSAFVVSTTLFWASRTSTAGAAWLASLVTVGLASRWLFAVPVALPTPGGPLVGAFLPAPWELWEWSLDVAPLLAAAALLMLYARRRLRDSEALLRAGS